VRWLLEWPLVAGAIIGARKVDQPRDTLGATGWRLPKALYQRLDARSALPRRNPRTMEDGMV
jgi:aryl-alcohol dehydrogenase-like predicted oxidoreductase